MNRKPDISAADALQRLIDGNERFQRGEARSRGGVPRETLMDLARGQHPFAMILGCSDSRVPPETIFDVGLGELFVARVAGNVVSPEVAASMQYGGFHLQIPLLVVLGHEGCGAIQAALETKYKYVQQHSRIQLLMDTILPALDEVDPHLSESERLAQAVEMNVRFTLRGILDSPEARERQAEGRVKYAGAIYEIETGRVRFLDLAGAPGSISHLGDLKKGNERAGL